MFAQYSSKFPLFKEGAEKQCKWIFTPDSLRAFNIKKTSDKMGAFAG
jgi:hypothetical protein